MQKTNGSATDDYREVVGIIIPNAWDAEGRATAWAISAYNEKVYLIDTENEMGRRIGDYSGSKIKASGFIIKSNESIVTLTIVHYEIVEDSYS
jgi:hypothetical protein